MNGGAGNRHMILFVAHFFILMFLLIEAQRYCFYYAFLLSALRYTPTTHKRLEKECFSIG